LGAAAREQRERRGPQNSERGGRTYGEQGEDQGTIRKWGGCGKTVPDENASLTQERRDFPREGTGGRRESGKSRPRVLVR